MAPSNQLNQLSGFLEDLLHMFEHNPAGLELDAEMVAFFVDGMKEAVAQAQALEDSAAAFLKLHEKQPLPRPRLSRDDMRRMRARLAMLMPGTNVVVLPFALQACPAGHADQDFGGAA